ncbi:MAG: hypothetical protein AB1634_11990 [Thermodesulfobacteriota bacterium]
MTILDSRAGMHDIAAVSVTRLNALSLLFAANTAQTWSAYAALFSHWSQHCDRARAFRDSLRLVAAQVPETDTVAYMEGIQ